MGYECGFVVLVELPVQQAEQLGVTWAGGHGVFPIFVFEAMDPAKSPLLFMVLIPLVQNNTRILNFHILSKVLSCPTKLPMVEREATGKFRSEPGSGGRGYLPAAS
jgi:hypothetical protein